MLAGLKFGTRYKRLKVAELDASTSAKVLATRLGSADWVQAVFPRFNSPSPSTFASQA